VAKAEAQQIIAIGRDGEDTREYDGVEQAEDCGKHIGREIDDGLPGEHERCCPCPLAGEPLRHSGTHIRPTRENLEDSRQQTAGCALARFLLIYAGQAFFAPI
jgi:hypothetical protein